MIPLLVYARSRAASERVMSAISEAELPHKLLADARDYKEASRFLEAESGILLSVSQTGTAPGALELSRRAFERNRDSYCVLLLGDPGELVGALDGTIRLAGALCLPVDPDQARSLFASIAEDYRRVAQGSGDSLVLKAGGSVYRVNCQDILYVEAVGKKLSVWTARQFVSVYESMQRLIEQLPGGFARCHRSYVVRLGAIASVNYAEMTITLTGGQTIPLSRGYKDEIKAVLAAE